MTAQTTEDTMLGLTKTHPGEGHLELVARPVPRPARGQVAIDVVGVGVCGTDLHIQAGEYLTAIPVTLGHEVSGIVVEVGQEVDPAWLGARVVSETFYSTCEVCDACRDGRPNLCPQRRSIGTHVDGAFARRLVVPARNLHALPEWLDGHAAALAEPLACVCRCLLDPTAVAPGDRVLVTGPGPMGLLAAQVARALGGSVTVAGLPSDASRLELAQRLGFAVSTGASPPPDVDVAIETSGAAGGAATCLGSVRKGGALVQVGIFGGPITVDADQLLLKELSFFTGFASTPAAWRRAMALIERRDVTLAPLVSEVASLHEWRRVFEGLRRGQGVKVVIDPRRSASSPPTSTE